MTINQIVRVVTGFLVVRRGGETTSHGSSQRWILNSMEDVFVVAMKLIVKEFYILTVTRNEIYWFLLFIRLRFCFKHISVNINCFDMPAVSTEFTNSTIVGWSNVRSFTGPTSAFRKIALHEAAHVALSLCANATLSKHDTRRVNKHRGRASTDFMMIYRNISRFIKQIPHIAFFSYFKLITDKQTTTALLCYENYVMADRVFLSAFKSKMTKKLHFGKKLKTQRVECFLYV